MRRVSRDRNSTKDASAFCLSAKFSGHSCGLPINNALGSSCTKNLNNSLKLLLVVIWRAVDTSLPVPSPKHAQPNGVKSGNPMPAVNIHGKLLANNCNSWRHHGKESPLSRKQVRKTAKCSNVNPFSPATNGSLRLFASSSWAPYSCCSCSHQLCSCWYLDMRNSMTSILKQRKIASARMECAWLSGLHKKCRPSRTQSESKLLSSAETTSQDVLLLLSCLK
mmetsp:Transcript_12425/g.34483  ORF Transcript_12425/g.34483 Transcript_12425/m.34483 type:complete len:222 (+) Transcript_12425:223-888(+)